MFRLLSLALMACVVALNGYAQSTPSNDAYNLIRRVSVSDLNTIISRIEGHELVRNDEDGAVYALAKTDSGLKYVMKGASCNDDGCLGLMVQVRYTVEWPQNWEFLNRANYKRAAATTMREGDDTLIVQRYLILDGGMTAKNIEFSILNLVAIAPMSLEIAKTGELGEE